MIIQAELLTVDFQNDTITFEVDKDFWANHQVRGGQGISEIETNSIEVKEGENK